MDTHQFQEGAKVQRFCLTLVEEVRLWYESLRPINVDWQGLQKSIKTSVFKNRKQKRAIIFMHGNDFVLMKIQKH